MDVRRKAFAAEAGRRFGFLSADYGFSGPEVIGAGDEYPLVRTLRYSRGGLAVEVSLVLSYMGEEYVITTLVTQPGYARPRRDEIGHSPARTGYQMRRALEQHADVARKLISQTPPDAGRTQLPIVWSDPGPAMKGLTYTDRRLCAS